MLVYGPFQTICTKGLFLSNCVHKFDYIPVGEHFSFSKVIHPPDRWGISLRRCTLCWGQLKVTLKCAVFLHNTLPQMSHVLRERAIGMLTAGMSTGAVARKFNVYFSTISHLQCRFREFGSTSNWPRYLTTTCMVLCVQAVC